MALLQLAADTRSPRMAREFVRQVLDGLGVSTQAIEDAQLVVTEVVTNAVVHAGTPIVVDIGEVEPGGRIRVRVTDFDPAVPKLKKKGKWAPSGRGLQIVDTLSTEWSVAENTGGKTVEVVLSLGAPVSADHHA